MSKENITARKTNIEIKAKLPCEKSPIEQLEIMEEYTRVHKETANLSKEERELACQRVIFPKMFRNLMEDDLFIGRFDALPIGFGSVTSLGGVAHYCHNYNLNKVRDQLETEEQKQRVDELVTYWETEDVKTKFMRDYTDGVVNTMANTINWTYAPVSSLTRISGMMLDYNKLMDNGISGLKAEIEKELVKDPENKFHLCSLEALDLFTECCDYLMNKLENDLDNYSEERKKEVQTIIDSLQVIRTERPKSFHQAMQLFWLYATMASVINYGRMDDVLGEYLQNDLDSGVITYEQAKRYVKNLWTMIENKRTTVNGRVIVGGRGRRNPKAADTFTRIALEVCHECRYVEPQFTLRLYEDTPQDIFDKAMECLADGATYPTLYNGAVHVPGLMNCMHVNEKEAEQYAPFGCGEMNLVGMTVGTPNSVINLSKTLNIAMNAGVDPFDNVYKAGEHKVRPIEELNTFEELFEEFGKLTDYYVDLCVDAQINSYKNLNAEVSFLYNSILMDNCIERGKALLDGGAKYLGGCCEIFGNINCSDSLYAIKKLVFDDKKYTLKEVNDAVVNNFKDNEVMRKEMIKCKKYGNDEDDVDEMANRVYERVAKRIWEQGVVKGLHYYGIVIINNQTNTDWGLHTAATPDGRTFAMYLNPSNNPQGGADKNGPTAMLNSLAKFDAKYHVGSVQNIKFQKSFFKENMDKIKMLIKAYFKKGGCQVMVTVVDKHALEDAMVHPEKYPNLIVRVSGFSAVFVNLDRAVQEELLSRTLYEGI